MVAKRGTSEFEQLKQMLSQDQARELEVLRARVQELDREQVSHGEFRSSLANDLVDAIALMPEDRQDRLTHLLSAMLADSVDGHIKSREPALLDQMNQQAGSMVKRGIVQALADFAESIQAQINQQLSFTQRAKNQMSAIRHGTDEGAIVMQRALAGQAREAMLIHRPTGLLIVAVRDEDHAQTLSLTETKEDWEAEEAVKGSLITAIIGFADDVMGTGEALSTLKFGGKSLILSAQNLSILAVEFEGALPVGINAWLDEHLADLSTEQHDYLSEFEGDLDGPEIAQIEAKLRAIIAGEGRERVAPDKGGEGEAPAALPETWPAMAGKALPLAAAFFLALALPFFIIKSLGAMAAERQALALAQQVIPGYSADLDFKYSPATDTLRARDGTIFGQTAFDVFATALAAEFAPRMVDLDALETAWIVSD